MSDLQRLLLRLSEAGIDFVLVGGYAAILHGSSALTRDIDVCAALTTENIEKLRDALRDAHPVHRLSVERPSFLDEPRPGVPLNHLYLHTDLGTLDLLSSITGVGDFERVVRDAVEVELFGHRIRAISLDDQPEPIDGLPRNNQHMTAI